MPQDRANPNGLAEVVLFSKLNGDFAEALRELKQRKHNLAEIAVDVSDGELQSAADAFRVALGLTSPEQTIQWLAARDMTLDHLEEYLEESLLLYKRNDGLENHDDERGEGRAEKPRTYMALQIHLTDACNIRCRHCYHNEDHTYTYMTEEQFDYVLSKTADYMRANGFAPGQVFFCGGEPTLSPILQGSIRKCREMGFSHCSVLTNGLKIDAPYAKSLADAGCTQIQICIEGNRETHNRVRCGTFDKVLEAWKVCKEAGLEVNNQTTITPENIRQIPEIIEICQDRVDRVAFLRAIPHNKDMGVLTDRQWLDALEYFFRLKMSHGAGFDDFIIIRDIFWHTLFQNKPYTCIFRSDLIRNSLTVESNGDIINCRKSGIVQGNIFENDIEYANTASPVTLKIRERETAPECAACENLALCGGGGCVGVANAAAGDPCAMDPQCVMKYIDEGYWLNWAKENEKLPLMSWGLSDDPAAEEREAVRYLWLSGRGDRAACSLAAVKELAAAAQAEGYCISERDRQKAFVYFSPHPDKKLTGGAATVCWLRDYRIPLDEFMRLYTMALLADPSHFDAEKKFKLPN